MVELWHHGEALADQLGQLLLMYLADHVALLNSRQLC